MFCTNCGSQIPDGSAFCDQCGAQQMPQQAPQQPVQPQQQYMGQQPIQQPYMGQQMGGPAPMQKAPMKKPPKNVMIAAVAVVVVAIMAIIAIKNIKPKISLNDYVTVEFNGYDTKGTAEVSFDKDAFIAAYANKVKKYNGVLSDSARYTLKNGGSYCELLLEECVDGDLDVDRNLSNGDTITLTWDCDDETALSMYGVKLSYEDITYEVSGLTNVTVIDLFEDVTVSYMGTAPNGYVDSIVNNSNNEYTSDAYFYCNNGNGLSNGDEITVTASLYHTEDYYLEQYGVIFDSLEKTYTVDGLGSYVSSLDEITDDILNSMKSQAKDTLTAYAANNWRNGQTLEDMEYLGSYLLTPKSSDYSGDKNQLVLVYKITSSDNFTEQGIYNQFTYYYTTTFTNLIVLPDGTLSVDLSRYSTSSDSFSRKAYYGERAYDYYNFYYYGYETFETMFNKAVTSKIEKYNYSSNVTQK